MIPASVLKRVREDAGIKQSLIASRLGVSPSVVSRLEKTDTVDETMSRRYLEEVGTPASADIIAFYARDWKKTDRPSPYHPDREALWAAELSLQKLADFERSEDYDALLSTPLELIRSNLQTAAAFVSDTSHSIAFVGTVGVGKTTALSLLTNLVIEGKNGQPQPVFPASGGRTTTSEVVIRIAPAYGIAVEPKTSDEVRLLVAEMVRSIADGKGGISTELDRTIRNMGDLKKQRDQADPKNQIDPVRELLAAAGGSQDDVTEIIFNKLKLSERTETQLILSETTDSGLQWLSSNITAINFGHDARFSIPERVTVFVPPNAIRQSKYDLSIIDTKGIHVTTDRPDLQALTIDPRTLTVLCSSFNDAPGADPLKLLKSMSDELGSDAIEKQRVVILVLPRGDEAIRVIDDSGEPADTVEYGYSIRSSQIANSLAEAGVGTVPVLFFNAMEGSSATAWQGLEDHIDLVRQHQVDRLKRFVGLSEDLVANVDAARIQQAQLTIREEMRTASQSYGRLPTSVRPAHQTLIEEIRNGHPSSIAAAVARRGTWYNFEIHHFIGTGVRVDANRRSYDYTVKITSRIESLEEKFSHIPEITGLLQTLKEDMKDWRQEFLARAVTIGRNTFKPYLDGSTDFWADLKVRYGGGKGYREDVARMVQEWFETETALADARKKVDSRLTSAWNELVVQRLIAATEIEEGE